MLNGRGQIFESYERMNVVYHQFPSAQCEGGVFGAGNVLKRSCYASAAQARPEAPESGGFRSSTETMPGILMERMSSRSCSLIAGLGIGSNTATSADTIVSAAIGREVGISG
jgi:hypothetical protein